MFRLYSVLFPWFVARVPSGGNPGIQESGIG